jgi:hypothetical protein
MDNEQLLRERREREGESGGTGRESESERDREEREGEERGVMSGETRERARASASQASGASTASRASGASGASGAASGASASGASSNVGGGHKATDHTGCNVSSCGCSRGCSCAAPSSDSDSNNSKSKTSDRRVVVIRGSTQAHQQELVVVPRSPGGTTSTSRSMRARIARGPWTLPLLSQRRRLARGSHNTPLNSLESHNRSHKRNSLSSFALDVRNARSLIQLTKSSSPSPHWEGQGCGRSRRWTHVERVGPKEHFGCGVHSK